MKRRPRDASKPILTAPRWIQILGQGSVMTAAALLVAYVLGPLFGNHGDVTNAEVTRSMLFATIVFCELFHVFAYRSETKSVFSAEAFKNKWLNIGVAVSMALQVFVINIAGVQDIFHLVDLAWAEWAAVLLVAVLCMAINDGIGLIIDRVMRGKE